MKHTTAIIHLTIPVTGPINRAIHAAHEALAVRHRELNDDIRTHIRCGEDYSALYDERNKVEDDLIALAEMMLRYPA